MIRPVLDIQESATDRRRVLIESEVLRLGRLEGNDVQLLHPHVSKQHAEIRRRGEDFVIVDLASKAGVLVNGVRVREKALSEGDLITFGATSLPSVIFRSGSLPSSADPTTGPGPDAGLLQTLGIAGGSGGLERLARFLEFSRILGRSLGLNDILENVVDLAMEVTGAERGFLIMKRREGSEAAVGGGLAGEPGCGPLEYRTARGRGRTALTEDEARASETIVRQVLESGATRVVADVSKERGLEDMWSVAYFNVRSAVALPLRRVAIAEQGDAARPPPGRWEAGRLHPDDSIFGVLYLDSRAVRSTFDRIDRDILESLARDASAAIDNARLLRESEERRRLEEEMSRAREIQSALLPEQFWSDEHFEVSGTSAPSLRLGGDYLDQFRLPDGRCCLVVADVSGKGLPASLLAAILQGAMGAEARRDQPLGDLVQRVNRAVCRRAPAGKYVTFFCCALSRDGSLEYVNAGHVPPLVAGPGPGRDSGGPHLLFTGDMALGIREAAVFRAGSLRLEPGEVVVLYTDGVTEAADPGGNRFEESRLEALLERAHSRPAGEIVRSITDAVRLFSGDGPPQDDITVLVLKFLGTTPGET